MEGSPGRTMSVQDLWKAFRSAELEQADGRVAERAQSRFGQGLVALQMMGLHLARGGSSSVPGEAFRGWRLRRRHFGRAWLRKRRPLMEKLALQGAWPATEALEPGPPAEQQLALPDPAAAQAPRPRLPPWCMWQGARTALAAPGGSAQEGLLSGRGVKRPVVPARQPQTSTGLTRGKKVAKQRVRMFMG
mmetsp:Transcript_4725/g.14063  ORF Transcript_4725/g.14063 Transcript_4725/m.14063 type:complete len:190 (+) Transcript_4725:1-570(+)